MGGISIWQLLIVAVIVIMLFGTKKLRGMGGDIGHAVKGFKDAMKEEDKAASEQKEEQKAAISEKNTNSSEQTESEKKSDQNVSR